MVSEKLLATTREKCQVLWTTNLGNNLYKCLVKEFAKKVTRITKTAVNFNLFKPNNFPIIKYQIINTH